MQAKKNRIAVLAVKYLKDDLTREESTELIQFIIQSHENSDLFNLLTNIDWIVEQLTRLSRFDSEKGWEKVMEKYNGLVEARRRRRIIIFFPYYFLKFLLTACLCIFKK